MLLLLLLSGWKKLVFSVVVLETVMELKPIVSSVQPLAPTNDCDYNQQVVAALFGAKVSLKSEEVFGLGQTEA